MINYRVDDMDGMIVRLTTAGVPILQGPEVHENGHFAWIMDPEGNKVELWEPKIWDEKKQNIALLPATQNMSVQQSTCATVLKR